MKFPYGKHKIFNSDIKSVIKVLQSNSLTQGPLPLKFESEIAKYCKSKYSVSANSATSCLHISCLALGLKKRRFFMDSSQYFCCFSKLWNLLWS